LSQYLIIVDPCVRDFVGHHLEYNEAIVRAAEEAGLSATTLGHSEMPDEIQRRIHGVRCFSHDIWKRYPALARISPLLEVLWLNLLHFVEIRRGLRQARRAATAPNASAGTGVIFAPMVTLHQLLAWSWFAALFGNRRRPVVLHLGYQPSFYQGPGADRAFRLLEWAARRGKARLVSDSARMAEAYAHLTLAPVSIFPIPLTGKQSTEPDTQPLDQPVGTARRIRFVALGGARGEKGIFELIAAIIQLEEQGQAGHLSFTLQCNSTDPAIDAAVDDLARRGFASVDLIRAPLPSEAYKALLTGADAVLLPYRRQVYQARSSGVFVEAAAAGKPMIVTADTWMSDELERFGAGIVCADLDPPALVQAILDLTASLAHYRQAARTRQVDCLDWHSPKTLIDVLFGRRSSEATRRIGTRVGVFYPWGDILQRRAGASVRTNLMVDFLRDHVDHLRVVQEGRTPTDQTDNVTYESVEIRDRRPVFHWLFQRWWALFCRGEQARLPIYLWYHLRHRGDRQFRLRIHEVVRWADIVLLEYPFWGDVVTKACRQHGKQLILTHHDMMHQIATDCAPLRRALLRYDIAWSRAADSTVTVTAEDRQTLAALNVPSTEIRMPVDIAGLAPLTDGKSRLLLRELYGIDLDASHTCLFVGSNHIPNQNAVIELRHLAKIARERFAGNAPLFVVAGSCAEPQRHDNFIALGSVDDVALRLLYEATDLVLIPLRHGLGASIKTIEAMAAGKPVIGTALSFRGYPIVSGRDCLVEDSLDRYPELIQEMLTQPGKAEAIRTAARQFAESYDYRRVNAAYLPLMGLPDQTASPQAPSRISSAAGMLKKLGQKVAEQDAADPLVIKTVQDVLARHGMASETVLMLAKMAENQGNLAEAAAHYGEAVALDPTNFFIRLDRSRLLRTLAQRAEADTEDRQVIALHTKQLQSPSGWRRGMEMTWQLFYASRHDDALELLKPMLWFQPADGEANYLAGLCLQSKGTKPWETLDHYNRALAANFNEYWVRYHRARILSQFGRRIAAKIDRMRCNWLSRKDPALGKSALEDSKATAWRLFNAGRYRAALKQIRQHLRSDPENGEWHYLAAQALHNSRGDGGETLQHYNRALELGFDRFWVLCNRGYLRYQRADLDGAESDLTAALALQPDQDVAQQRLAQVLKALGRQ